MTRNDCISHIRSRRVAHRTEEEWVKLASDDQENISPLDLERLKERLIEAIFEKLSLGCW